MSGAVFEIGKASVTLRGIRRAGQAWKGRQKWSGKTVFIWSAEHTAFWRPNGNGYTMHANQAGVFAFADAYARTAHCGPEKKIGYVEAVAVPSTTCGAPGHES